MQTTSAPRLYELAADFQRLLDGLQAAETYVACSGCGARNAQTTDPHWNCPDFPNCAVEPAEVQP